MIECSVRQPANRDSRESLSCSCSKCDSSKEIHLIFDINKGCGNKNVSEKKDGICENIRLSDVANQFESILQRIKDFELWHLVDPIKSTAEKLRQLENVTEKLASAYNETDNCAIKTCCEEANKTNSEDDQFFDAPVMPVCRERSGGGNVDQLDACECCNDEGTRSCRSGSEESSSSEPKCDPCRCSQDAYTGKKIKTQDCRMAAKTRRQKRNDQRRWRSTDERPRTADARLTSGCSAGKEKGDIVVENTLSSTRIGIQTNFNEMSFSISRENTLVRNTTYLRVQERNQGISCNLSSSEDSDSEWSSDGMCYIRNYKNGNNGAAGNATSKGVLFQPRGCFKKREQSPRSDLTLGSCGCGCLGAVAGESEAAASTCPCGCGDVMDKPGATRSLQCRCENCGKEIAESWPSLGDARRAEKSVPFDDSAKKAARKTRGDELQR